MKKLFLFLLLSLSYITSAEVTYSERNSTLYGDDGSECDIKGRDFICENLNGDEVFFDKSGSTWYGDDGSECKVSGSKLVCKSHYEANEYLIKAVENGEKTGELMGQAFGEIFNALFGGNSNNQGNSQTLENGYLKNTTWHCNPGYGFKGYTDSNGYYKQRCVKAPCDIGYFKDRDTNTCMKVPENAAKYSGAEGWYCKSGYRKYLDKCIRK